MAKEVLIRRKQLHGNANRMVRCTVLAEKSGMMRCKCQDQRKTEEIKASEAVPAHQVFGQGQGAQTIIQKQYSPSVHSFSNSLK
jgi:hypothetical protein